MYKCNMKLLYIKEFFCTWTELLNFKITLLLANLHMIGSSLVLNALIFPDDILDDNQLVAILLSAVSELNIGAKTIKFW